MASEREQIQSKNHSIIIMELAIEKAMQLSPYAGIAAVLTTAAGKVLDSFAAYVNQAFPAIEGFLEKQDCPEGMHLFLTQEPCSDDKNISNLIQNICEKNIVKVYLTNPCIGEKSGEFIKLLEKSGVTVEKGIATDKLKFQNNIFAEYYLKDKPWVSGFIAVDEQGNQVHPAKFINQFGFATQLKNVISRYPLVVVNDVVAKFFSLKGLETALKGFGNIQGIVVNINNTLDSDAAINEFMNSCTKVDCASVLLGLDVKSMNTQFVLNEVNELIVYRYNPGSQDPEESLDFVNNTYWDQVDSSPIGDCIFYRFIKKQG